MSCDILFLALFRRSTQSLCSTMLQGCRRYRRRPLCEEDCKDTVSSLNRLHWGQKNSINKCMGANLLWRCTVTCHNPLFGMFTCLCRDNCVKMRGCGVCIFWWIGSLLTDICGLQMDGDWKHVVNNALKLECGRLTYETIS